MTIQFSAIARGTTVLCSTQSGTGNFTETLQSMLRNIPSNTDGKRTYTSNNYEFHCLIDNGILFICATNTGINKQQPYGFLAEIKRRFQSGALAAQAMTAFEGDLDKDFNFVLSQQMKKFSQQTIATNSGVSALQSQVDEVKDVMSQNIERVLERGDRLEDLMDKTDDLEAGAANFRRTTTKIRKRFWWRNKRLTLIIVGIVLVVIIILTIIILFSTHVLPPDSGDDDKKTSSKPIN